MIKRQGSTTPTITDTAPRTPQQQQRHCTVFTGKKRRCNPPCDTAKRGRYSTASKSQSSLTSNKHNNITVATPCTPQGFKKALPFTTIPCNDVVEGGYINIQGHETHHVYLRQPVIQQLQFLDQCWQKIPEDVNNSEQSNFLLPIHGDVDFKNIDVAITGTEHIGKSTTSLIWLLMMCQRDRHMSMMLMCSVII